MDACVLTLCVQIGAFLQATAMLYIALYVKFAKPDSTGGTPAGGIVGIVWIYIYAFGWYVIRVLSNGRIYEGRLLTQR